jgi:hypothetical protein
LYPLAVSQGREKFSTSLTQTTFSLGTDYFLVNTVFYRV